MRNSDVRDAASFHVAQSTPTSCVAACVCMARRRRGDMVLERDVLAAWGSGGPFSLRLHTTDLRAQQYPPHVDPDSRQGRDWLVAALRSGYWVIVSIMPFPHPNGLHAVVLVGLTEADGFVYLDPAEAGEAQPLAFSEDDFVRQWTGEMTVVEVP